jgi:hypothetical protein
VYVSLNVSARKMNIGGACSIIDVGKAFTISKEYLREGDHLGDPSKATPVTGREGP